MQYRREIDGLRAIAVLPVILFHAGFESFSGGYVGVDVFFVISGYLITTIILTEQENGKFSILTFYERRARRILPALFLVMICCIPFAWLWMFPAEFKDFAQSIVAVIFFSSNILFWRESDYFSAAAEEKPLLHTWSLAVEEQYYVVFPLIIILFWGLGRNRLIFVIAIIAALSFTLSEYGWRKTPDANFYLAPFRAWELLVGSLCAFDQVKHGQRRNQILSITGFVFISLSVFIYSDTTPFPSVYALLPVVGTALIILYAKSDTYLSKLLSHKFFVGVGLISYSAYLWHQPLFAFARIRSLSEPPHWLMLVLAGLALLMAYFSWKYVELPFRKRGKSERGAMGSPTFLILSGITVAILLAAVGVFGHVKDGIPSRFGTNIANLFEVKKEAALLRKNCLLSHDFVSKLPLDDCIYGKNHSKNVVLWGDSHADMLAPHLGAALDEEGISLVQMTYNGCPPIVDLKRKGAAFALGCKEFNDKAFQFIEDNDTEAIILSARWPMVVEGSVFSNGEGGNEKTADPIFDLDELSGTETQEVKRQKIIEHIREKIQSYLNSGRKIILVYPVPEAGWDVPYYLARKSLMDGPNKSLSTGFDKYLDRNKNTLMLFDNLDHPNLYRVIPHEKFCNKENNGRCTNLSEDGQLLYYDTHHLTADGVKLVAPEIIEVLKNITHN